MLTALPWHSQQYLKVEDSIWWDVGYISFLWKLNSLPPNLPLSAHNLPFIHSPISLLLKCSWMLDNVHADESTPDLKCLLMCQI